MSDFNGIPAEMTVGGRTYEILSFLKERENCVWGNTMVSRAKKMNANLGQDDGKHILKHRNEIPAALRGKVSFIFTDWRRSGARRFVACLGWDGGCWCLFWYLLDDDWNDDRQLLRRKAAA